MKSMKQTDCAPEMETREVRTSLAAAITLGLEKGRFASGVRLNGLNLVLNYEDGCHASCAYCGLSKERRAGSNTSPEAGCGSGEKDSTTFIRVKWPSYSLADILPRAAAAEGKIKRVCVGMLTHQHCLEDAVEVIRAFRRETALPISALVTATLCRSRRDMEELRAAGADRMAVAVDAATPELFDRHRGRAVRGPHRWGHYWQVLDWGVEVFGPRRAGCHLVVGLGETEEQMVRAIQEVRDRGGVTHLFSFFPEEGSPLENWPQPPLGQYRRVQLARYLIDEGLSDWPKMRFNPAGQLVDFGCPTTEAVAIGKAFMTPGCPDEETGEVACNRPFGNERPSEPFRNFPYRPGLEEVAQIRGQLEEGLEIGRENLAL